MPPPRCARSPSTEPASPCGRGGSSKRTSSAVRCGSCCRAGKPSRWPSAHCIVGSTAGRRAYGRSSSICVPRTGAAPGGDGPSWLRVRQIGVEILYPGAMRGLVLAVAASLACTSNAAKKPPVDQFPPGAQGAVLQHHGDAVRSGIYVDAALTRAAVRNLRQDAAFSATYQGPVYAQPLYWDAGTGGQDLLLVFTERNEVIAFDPLTGARIWSRTLAQPASLAELPCGNIDPLGITGTPIIDPARKLLFVDAMITGPRHRIFTLSLADGSVSGTPVDLDTAVSGFSSAVQNQRGALALMNGILYVPFSGHFGDCGNYAGWVVGIDTTGARPPGAYHSADGLVRRGERERVAHRQHHRRRRGSGDLGGGGRGRRPAPRGQRRDRRGALRGRTGGDAQVQCAHRCEGTHLRGGRFRSRRLHRSVARRAGAEADERAGQCAGISVPPVHWRSPPDAWLTRTGS